MPQQLLHANAFQRPRKKQKMHLPLGGSSSTSNTWLLGPTQIFIQNGICMGTNAMLCNPLSMEKKTPKIAPSPLDVVTL